MKTLKTVIAIAIAILSIASLAQAAPPQCSSACSKKANCGQPCRVDHFAPTTCGAYHLCDPKTSDRIGQILEAPPSRPATVRDVLAQTVRP